MRKGKFPAQWSITDLGAWHLGLSGKKKCPEKEGSERKIDTWMILLGGALLLSYLFVSLHLLEEEQRIPGPAPMEPQLLAKQALKSSH